MSACKRRQFLGLGALLLAPLSHLQASAVSQKLPVLISAVSDPQEQHWVQAVNLQQSVVSSHFKQALPGRGHHVAVSVKKGLYIAVARRPGNWLVVGDSDSGEIVQTVRLPAGRHLYGHGVFSADEERFYTTESDYENLGGNSGLVVEWLLEKHAGKVMLRRGREFLTAGVGPHELALMPDGKTVVVANGGLRTHPESSREVLNAESMLPSLVYIDSDEGDVLEQVFLPAEYHQCSIRHLDVNAAGQVALGMQFQGEPFRVVPLIATHLQGGGLQLLSTPPELQNRMQQYVGSVRFSADGRFFAASCPRGNTLTFWDAEQGQYLDAVRARDACGIYATDQGFLFSSGIGKVSSIDLGSRAIEDFSVPDSLRIFWDNHLSSVSGSPVS